MTLDDIENSALNKMLTVFGAFHPGRDEMAPEGTGTLVLLGPAQPGFWAGFTASPEYRDGARDPLDRWSARMIRDLADQLSAKPFFPFGGPPHQPFIR